MLTQKQMIHLEEELGFFYKVRISNIPAILFLGIHPKVRKTYIYKDSNSNVHGSVVHNHQTGNNPTSIHR